MMTDKKNYHPLSWLAVAGVSLVAAGTVILGRRMGSTLSASVEGGELTGEPAIVESDEAADEPTPGGLTPAENAPVWQQLTATQSGTLTDETLVFSLSGKRVDRMVAGQRYYVVDRHTYENFVPKTMGDLIKLQLPTETLRPMTETSGFVVLAANWRVPEDIPGQLHFQVDSWEANNLPAGSWASGPVTVWMLAWGQK